MAELWQDLIEVRNNQAEMPVVYFDRVCTSRFIEGEEKTLKVC